MDHARSRSHGVRARYSSDQAQKRNRHAAVVEAVSEAVNSANSHSLNAAVNDFARAYTSVASLLGGRTLRRREVEFGRLARLGDGRCTGRERAGLFLRLKDGKDVSVRSWRNAL